MVYFDKPYLQIFYDFSSRCAVNTWKGYLTHAEYQEALHQCAEVIHRTGATAIIANLRQLATLMEPENLVRANLSWLADARVSEVEKIAFIVNDQTMEQLAAGECITPVDDHFLVSRYFDSLEAARRWVAQK
jgi:hypothetical protein